MVLWTLLVYHSHSLSLNFLLFQPLLPWPVSCELPWASCRCSLTASDLWGPPPVSFLLCWCHSGSQCGNHLVLIKMYSQRKGICPSPPETVPRCILLDNSGSGAGVLSHPRSSELANPSLCWPSFPSGCPFFRLFIPAPWVLLLKKALTFQPLFWGNSG